MMLSWMFVPGWGDSMGNFSPNSARHFDFVRIVRSVAVAMAVALALDACGGGDGGGAATVETPMGFTLAVRVVDSGGQPIARAGVNLNGGFDGMARETDQAGNVTFEFIRKPVGNASVLAYSSDYYPANRRFVIDAVDGKVLELSLLRRNQLAIGVTRVAGVASPDASTLTIDADISVADATGGSIGVLHLADFSLPGSDFCDWGDCFIEPPGSMPSTNFWLPAPGPNPVSAAPFDPPPSATYRVRYALVSGAGAFSAGRIVHSAIGVRLGPDTWQWLDVIVPL